MRARAVLSGRNRCVVGPRATGEAQGHPTRASEQVSGPETGSEACFGCPCASLGPRATGEAQGRPKQACEEVSGPETCSGACFGALVPPSGPRFVPAAAYRPQASCSPGLGVPRHFAISMTQHTGRGKTSIHQVGRSYSGAVGRAQPAISAGPAPQPFIYHTGNCLPTAASEIKNHSYKLVLPRVHICTGRSLHSHRCSSILFRHGKCTACCRWHRASLRRGIVM